VIEDGESGRRRWPTVQADGRKLFLPAGMGYTVISSEKNGLSSEVRYFVPLDKHWKYGI